MGMSIYLIHNDCIDEKLQANWDLVDVSSLNESIWVYPLWHRMDDCYDRG